MVFTKEYFAFFLRNLITLVKIVLILLRYLFSRSQSDSEEAVYEYEVDLAY